MAEMTKRERMIAALSNKEADRIPVAPDTSYMIPCRHTGKKYWDIMFHGEPQLWRAYLDVVDYFDFDGWFMNGGIGLKTKGEPTPSKITEEMDDRGRMIWTQEIETPAGMLRQKQMCSIDDVPTFTEKLIKDFKEDFPKFKYLYPEIVGYDDEYFQMQKKELGERGIMGIGIFPPGFQIFFSYFDGNLEALTYAYYDYPELFEELVDMYTKFTLKQLEMILEVKPDSILTGGSGSITMQSPELFDELSLPVMKTMTKMCKEAGVISGVHSCGKEMHLLKVCAEQTDLNYANPLEIPPMGDCELAEAKRLFGHKLALMGNLHTTDIMLNGSVKDVRRESVKAMIDAGAGGGFVLSTGDQPGRDTPYENLFEMVKTCREFGKYPLNMDAMKDEYVRLGGTL